MMEESLAIAARHIIEALGKTGSCLGGGVIPGNPEIHVQVESGPGELCYACNLGLKQPTRIQAEGMLSALLEYGRQLAAACPEYREFCIGRTVSARLFVDSGPMDFPVASRSGDEITWFYPLPESAG